MDGLDVAIGPPAKGGGCGVLSGGRLWREAEQTLEVEDRLPSTRIGRWRWRTRANVAGSGARLAEASAMTGDAEVSHNSMR